MKERALELALAVKEPLERLNLLREYLQALALGSLHESRAFEHLSFVGGTALRFLYGLPRFSEDLDFSLESPDGYDPLAWMRKLKRDFEFLGFELELSWNDRKPVHTAWLRVAGLLNEAGLSAHPGQKLAIKLEIDSRPPGGASTSTGFVNRHVAFALRHHDLPSLMAGKVHALLARPWTKGRDWFDLLWYLGRRPPTEPNSTLLVAALEQSGIHYGGDWREGLRIKIPTLDFDQVRADVAPFLELPAASAYITAEHLLGVLTGAGGGS